MILTTITIVILLLLHFYVVLHDFTNLILEKRKQLIGKLKKN